jgi:5'-nucleotidase
VLLTNDDGIDAPGLKVLVRVLADWGEVQVVAPVDGHSGCGHQLSIGETIRVERRDQGHWAVHGTPADCVRLALAGLVEPPALVVSGVNAGANLGVDLYRSGTTAAAREAAHHGVNAIAVSQYRRRDAEFPWHDTPAHLRLVLAELAATPPPRGHYWNVNLPHRDPGAPPPAGSAAPPGRRPGRLPGGKHRRLPGHRLNVTR